MTSRSRSLLLLVAAALLFVASGLYWRSRDNVRTNAEITDEVRALRAELVEELKPVTLSNCQWTRVGSANDGGYAMCGNLLAGIETAYSYWIGGNDDWGCQVSAEHKVPVHQYDCFNPTSPPCQRGGNLQLNVECIGPKTEKVDG